MYLFGVCVSVCVCCWYGVSVSSVFCDAVVLNWGSWALLGSGFIFGAFNYKHNTLKKETLVKVNIYFM